jgi:3-oxoadipate CoA-transferase alpha subunit
MISKYIESCDEAISDICDGATILIGGFGEAGTPTELIHALINQGAKNLTVVSNNAGNGTLGLAGLLQNRQVKKIICSYPRSSHSFVFNELYAKGEIELEVVPQGTLAERIRAAGAGIGAFYTPTGAGTVLAESRENRTIEGREYLLEFPIKADIALVKAEQADRWGNLIYNKAARNFGPIMCMAATTTVVQVKNYTADNPLDPESVITPGIFVNRVVEIDQPLIESEYLDKLEAS